jgi:hypothetical protein
MVKASVIDRSGYNDLDSFVTLGAAVDDIRQAWNEGDGPQVFICQSEEDGTILATLMRHETDPEVCITTFADGTVEIHRCTYVLDDEGVYDHTVIDMITN